MGGLITVPGDPAPDPRYRVLPYVGGMLGYFLFGADAEHSTRNLAFGGEGASIVGSPTIASDYIRCTAGQHYIQSGIPEAEEMTIYSVVRAPVHALNTYVDNAGSPFFYGTFTSAAAARPATSYGIGLYYFVADGASGARAIAARQDADTVGYGSYGAVSAVTDATAWVLYVQVIRANSPAGSGVTWLFNVTAGVKGRSPSTGGLPRDPSLGTLRFGSAYADFGGVTDLAAVVSCEGVHTPAQLAANATHLIGLMARRPVPKPVAPATALPADFFVY